MTIIFGHIIVYNYKIIFLMVRTNPPTAGLFFLPFRDSLTDNSSTTQSESQTDTTNHLRTQYYRTLLPWQHPQQLSTTNCCSTTSIKRTFIIIPRIYTQVEFYLGSKFSTRSEFRCSGVPTTDTYLQPTYVSYRTTPVITFFESLLTYVGSIFLPNRYQLLQIQVHT